MTPDKIKEAFEAYVSSKPDYYVGLGDFRIKHDSKVWKACAEWMLSQAVNGFNEYYYNSEIFKHHEDTARAAFVAARLSSAKEIEFAKKDFEHLSELHSVLSKKNEETENKLVRQSIHLNSMSEKIAEKDARIKTLEGEALQLFVSLKETSSREKYGKHYFETISIVTTLTKELASKKEST
jgi:hypothetical protein